MSHREHAPTRGTATAHRPTRLHRDVSDTLASPPGMPPAAGLTAPGEGAPAGAAGQNASSERDSTLGKSCERVHSGASGTHTLQDREPRGPYGDEVGVGIRERATGTVRTGILGVVAAVAIALPGAGTASGTAASTASGTASGTASTAAKAASDTPAGGGGLGRRLSGVAVAVPHHVLDRGAGHRPVVDPHGVVGAGLHGPVDHDDRQPDARQQVHQVVVDPRQFRVAVPQLLVEVDQPAQLGQRLPARGQRAVQRADDLTEALPGPVGSFLYEPDGAVIRAGLVGAVASG